MKTLKSSFFCLIIFTFAFIIPAIAQNSAQRKNQPQDRPLEITRKSKLSWDVLTKCFSEDQRNTFLLIKVRVTFHSTGKVTDVEIAETSGCDYFNEEAVRAARKTKFKPAIKNGEAVTVVKLMEYQAGIK